MGRLNKLYYSDTEELANGNETPISNLIDVDKYVELGLKNIYDNNGQFINEALFNIANTVLQHAIDDTFDNTSKQFIQKNIQFINQLKYNTGVFAAFKTHNQTELIKTQLLDDNGKLRSFSNFKNATQEIVSHHNKQWLQTEYNTAVRSARMAANWKQIEANRNIYPNIEYVISRSAHKDADHLKLVGTIKPIDDEFWKIYTPPLRWGCKCSIRASRNLPTDVPLDLPVVAPEFQFNPGTDAMIVNIEKHPYKNELKKQEALKVYDWYLNNGTKNLLKEYDNGGKLFEMYNIDKFSNDYNDLINLGELLAKDINTEVTILQKVHFKNELYKVYFNGGYKNKCPDLKIGDKFYEFESYTGKWNKNKISHMLHKGLRQSDNVIINVGDNYYTVTYIKHIAYDMIKSGAKINELLIFTGKKVIKIL